MTENKYPQITQITQISLWDEQRPAVEEVRNYKSYPLAQTIWSELAVISCCDDRSSVLDRFNSHLVQRTILGRIRSP